MTDKNGKHDAPSKVSQVKQVTCTFFWIRRSTGGLAHSRHLKQWIRVVPVKTAFWSWAVVGYKGLLLQSFLHFKHPSNCSRRDRYRTRSLELNSTTPYSLNYCSSSPIVPRYVSIKKKKKTRREVHSGMYAVAEEDITSFCFFFGRPRRQYHSAWELVPSTLQREIMKRVNHTETEQTYLFYAHSLQGIAGILSRCEERCRCLTSDKIKKIPHWLIACDFSFLFEHLNLCKANTFIA